jgi:sensor domain CHASE-containing protein
MAMSLDGLRAWIGMVERKLAMRTRVFLILVAIAVGGAAAAIYLGVDAQHDRVSEGDLQALQTELTTRIEALETKVESLEVQVQAKNP